MKLIVYDGEHAEKLFPSWNLEKTSNEIVASFPGEKTQGKKRYSKSILYGSLNEAIAKMNKNKTTNRISAIAALASSLSLLVADLPRAASGDVSW